MGIAAYPLSWPQGFPRSKVRERSRFSTTLNQALANVEKSLALFSKESGKAVSGIVISSNASLGNMRPDDTGIAVWFTWDGQQLCIPCDRYQKVEENVQAIHYVLEARRTELRHGTLHLVRATFAGFKSLPAPEGKHWKQVLKLKDERPTTDTVHEAYKRLSKKAHPDAGGSVEAMSELNAARDTALREIG